jgi:hypothetical protein
VAPGTASRDHSTSLPGGSAPDDLVVKRKSRVGAVGDFRYWCTTLHGFGVPEHVAILGMIGYQVNFWLPIPIGGIAYPSLQFSEGGRRDRLFEGRNEVLLESDVEATPRTDDEDGRSDTGAVSRPPSDNKGTNGPDPCPVTDTATDPRPQGHPTLPDR